MFTVHVSDETQPPWRCSTYVFALDVTMRQVALVEVGYARKGLARVAAQRRRGKGAKAAQQGLDAAALGPLLEDAHLGATELDARL